MSKAIVFVIAFYLLFVCQMVTMAEETEKVFLEIEYQNTINMIKFKDKRDSYYESFINEVWIDTEEFQSPIQENIKIKDFISTKYPQSPIKDDTQIFFSKGYEKGYTDQQITLLIAIAGTESGFTKNSYHNYWGIMCTRNGKTSTDCGWTTDEYAISRAYDLVGNYLKGWDGSREGLQRSFIGSYCQSTCSNWVSSTWYFYNELI